MNIMQCVELAINVAKGIEGPELTHEHEEDARFLYPEKMKLIY